MVQLGLCQEYENSLKGEYLLIFIKWKNNISIDKVNRISKACLSLKVKSQQMGNAKIIFIKCI